MFTSVLARTESRGMARREEFPSQDPAQRHRLTAGGLGRVWVRPETHPAQAVAS